MDEKLIGTVMHFFPRPMAAAIAIEEGTLALGEALHILGGTTDLHHRVDSMEIDHVSVPEAGAGDLVGIRVGARVREHDKVFKVEEAGP
jgi:putative protease